MRFNERYYMEGRSRRNINFIAILYSAWKISALPTYRNFSGYPLKVVPL